MTIGELIGPDQVIVGLRAADKAQLLQDLAGRAATALGLNSRSVFEALQARENLGSTGLGKGFALPHARLATIGRSFVLFARLARPIDFAAIDEQPVDLVILLLTPSDDAANLHLTTLATLSRPLRDAAFVRRLRQATDAAAVHTLLAAV